MNRRDFLIQSSVLTVGALAGSTLWSEAKPLKKFGLQLYSVRDLMPKDAKGTMQQLAKMGYTQFESYGGPQGFLWGMSGKESKKFLGDLGVQMVSTHFDMNTDLEKSIEMANEAGLKYLLCPYMGPQKSLDDWKKMADKFNEVGEKVTKGGLKFGYHNHDYSFKMQDGKIPHELLLANTDPKYVMFELDICWIVAAGIDAVAHLNQYGKRYELCHIKDFKRIDDKVVQQNLGKGIVDFKSICAAAQKQGMKYYLAEQEQYAISPMDSMKADADWLKKFSI